jgi:hypothetical protein
LTTDNSDGADQQKAAMEAKVRRLNHAIREKLSGTGGTTGVSIAKCRVQIAECETELATGSSHVSDISKEREFGGGVGTQHNRSRFFCGEAHRALNAASFLAGREENCKEGRECQVFATRRGG